MKFLYSNLHLLSLIKIRNYASMTHGKRLADLTGFENRKNSIYFRPSLIKNEENSNLNFKNSVVFFGGDGQDYLEIMEKHRENRRHAEWNIEKTAEIISNKFPHHNILIVKPSKMILGIFSSYSNFVPSKDYGIPEFRSNNHAWTHLKLLIENTYRDICGHSIEDNFWIDSKVVLIGFSKGCVVLNQLVWELPVLTEQQPIANEFINHVSDFYWLDGGHAGGKDTWITSADLLKILASLHCRIHVHVTPYQINDSRRPYLGKEYKKFSEYFLKLSAKNFERKLHFENEEATLDNHFKLLTVFESDKTG